MSESMNAEKNENLVALVIFSCLMVLKISILVALFAAYSEQDAMPIKKNTCSFYVTIRANLI